VEARPLEGISPILFSRANSYQGEEDWRGEERREIGGRSYARKTHVSANRA
jgi:hypothetical protein